MTRIERLSMEEKSIILIKDRIKVLGEYMCKRDATFEHVKTNFDRTMGMIAFSEILGLLTHTDAAKFENDLTELYIIAIEELL